MLLCHVTPRQGTPLWTPMSGGCQRVKERNCDPYSSLVKKIFDLLIFFSNKIFLFFHVYPRSELVQNPENNSISFPAYLMTTVSRKSPSPVKNNRKIKFDFVIDVTGQLYGHVTLTMWKLSKKCLSPFWRKALEVKRLSLLYLLIYTN